MTSIVDLPILSTITNSLVFVAADTSDNNRTKQVSLAQLVALSVGPRGLQGVQGVQGPTGPQGPVGPMASNQALYTTSTVTFDRVVITGTNATLTFKDGSVQTTAWRRTVQDLTGFSVGSVSLSVSELTGQVLTGNPTAADRRLYLPTAASIVAGQVLVIRNRSTSYSFQVFGGVLPVATVSTSSAITVACDGYSWFTT